MVPVLRFENLPLKFDWITLGVAYWILLAAQSIFAAVLLRLIGLPGEQMLKPFLARHRENPLRIIPLLLFFAILVWSTGWLRAFVLTVDAAALLELLNRQKAKGFNTGFEMGESFVERSGRAAAFAQHFVYYLLKRSSFLGMPRHSSAPKAAALLRRWTAT